jgi:hypothetical protein
MLRVGYFKAAQEVNIWYEFVSLNGNSCLRHYTYSRKDWLEGVFDWPFS